MQTWAILLNTLSLVFVCAVVFAFVSVFRRKMKYTTGILCCAGGLTVAMVASMYANNLLTGESYIVVQLNKIMAEYKNIIDSMDPNMYSSLFGEVQKAEIYSVFDAVRQEVLATYPSMMILTFLFLSFAAFAIVRSFARIRGNDVSHYPAFGDFIMPRSAVAAFLITFVVTLFATDGSAVYLAFTNVWRILSGVFVFCGLSFLDFHFRKVLKIGLIRFLIYLGAFVLLFMVVNFIGMALMIIGLADALFDFRNLRRPQQPQEPDVNGGDENGQ